jgi:hypothetical protein
MCQRGLGRRRTKSCGVSDAAEQNPAGYQTLQNKILQDIRCRRTKSCRVSDPTEQWHSCIHFITDVCSAGSEMFAFKIRVIKFRGTILLITCDFEYRCLAGEFFFKLCFTYCRLELLLQNPRLSVFSGAQSRPPVVGPSMAPPPSLFEEWSAPQTNGLTLVAACSEASLAASHISPISADGCSTTTL